jgi:Transposase domain (DUF772)
MLASAFVAKAVLGISTTADLIERLAMDRALRRICGFSVWKKLPSEATFSRAFAEFAAAGLAERTHAALVKEMLGEQLIGHVSRDGTAIEARERPAKREQAAHFYFFYSNIWRLIQLRWSVLQEPRWKAYYLFLQAGSTVNPSTLSCCPFGNL